MVMLGLTAGGWGHERMMAEEQRRKQQDQIRTQLQFETYASSMGGLGMMGADVPRGEGAERVSKRERSEDAEDRRDDDEGKRFRGGDEE
jgi:nuclear cap-binding protein subunit 2